MSVERQSSARAPDRRRQSTMPSLAGIYAPETPPMIDPASFRYPRLTPNLREMIQGFGQGVSDPNVSMNELLESPDPTAMYNSLQISSPALRDFYPQQSPMVQSTPSYDPVESNAERSERMTGACAEMNALFNCYPSSSTEPGYRSDGNQDGGVISLLSSQELRKGSADISASGVSCSRSATRIQREPRKNHDSRGSPSLSQTPPPVDTFTSSPSGSPEVQEKLLGKPARGRVAKASTKQSQSGKARRQAAKSNRKDSSSSSRVGTPDRKVGDVSGPPAAPSPAVSNAGVMPSNPLPMAAAPASAIAAASAMAMNPAMASMMPFACAMPPGMGTMLPAGAVHYQGRPMAFVTGAHGTELVPVDMLARATALQYGVAAQAAASHMMHSSGMSGSIAPNSPQCFEPMGGSRKKRRRQLLERSGCSEEQARQNRAHALTRLRQKKTMRSQQSSVRYACRKRIAMVRPRVNGRFATKEEVEECKRTEE